ncbi:MAG: magnesium/cobalt transporter CorA [SAR202 cluster bacterium]|nr:magnesium/cobalt transporter CorA [SAR202 cluster bacterium]
MTMVVACAGYEKGRRVADLDIASCNGFADGLNRFVWIGLHEPSEELLRSLQRQFGLHDLAVEDAFRAHQRPKVDVFGDSVFMVLRTAQRVGNAIEFGETHIFAGKGYVITVRHGASASYKEVRARCESAPELLKLGEAFVLYAIMDFVVDNYIPIVDSIERQVDRIEDGVQAGAVGRKTIKRIARLRRDLLHLRRAAAPMADLCNRLRRFDTGFIDEVFRPYYGDVHDHVLRVNEDIDILRDSLTAAFESHLLLASNKQNEVMRRLAGWAAILAVPTAVAGIYGMNFKHMPELMAWWGYPAVLSVIVAICSVLFIQFRRIGWL